MPTEVIIEIVRKIKEDNNSQMVTAVTPFGNSIDASDQGNVKVVIDNKGRALYFTRSQVNGAFHHLGIYAYRKDFLFEFVKLPQSNLEKLEKLEQLRALENGYQIGVVVGDWQSIGIDTERDLEQFKILKLSENVRN
jgi:3-deoxy-manno-octulosonate cytidylyltransferase (CMP-KDO synthetase)